jgi:DNA (cytosine-5)-methyltransferase 1
VQADVSQLDPAEFAPCSLLSASPPCQAFSVAGKGLGNRDVKVIYDATDRLMTGDCSREELALFQNNCQDKRSLLVVEPLRWALELMPEFIACEQVPPVLPLWEEFASCLRERGYQTWTGLLSAEQYGVPQTRQRAFLMAKLSGAVAPPEPTHQRYIAPPTDSGEPLLFDIERERIVAKGEEVLLPWISMADALGWGMSERPVTTITAGGSRQGGPDPLDGGSGARATLRRERDRGAWVVRTGANSMKHSRSGSKAGEGGVVPYERTVDAPAPTVDTKTGSAWTVTRPAPTIVTTRRSKDGLLVGRQMAEGEGENVGGWGYERPSTTIAGDSRVFQPGGHHEPGKQSQNAVRVNLAEASILQGFRPDYPFQGNKTEQFRQVGNAVPPPLARSVILALMGSEVLGAAA